MVQTHTVLKAADNTGAHKLRVIHLYGGSKRKFSYVGDTVRCVVDGANPNGAVKDSEMVFVVIVRTKKEQRRSDGSYIRFSENAGVVITARDNPDPLGSRVFGPVARELKEKGFSKIVSMAGEVL